MKTRVVRYVWRRLTSSALPPLFYISCFSLSRLFWGDFLSHLQRRGGGISG